jgi:hypothetical protein
MHLGRFAEVFSATIRCKLLYAKNYHDLKLQADVLNF